MQKRWIVPGLLAAAFAFAATGLANNGHGHGHNGGKFGPYGVVTDDHGSCSNAWASDTELRDRNGIAFRAHHRPARPS